MIHPKKLAQMAKKWQRMEAIRRKTITTTTKDANASCTSVAGKGHCVVYTCDERRFEVPLAFLGTKIFGELLRMSQEEFGFTNEGRITLPCDAMLMEYVMCLLRRKASEEVERALLSSIVMPSRCAGCMIPSMGLKPVISNV